ncbi:FixH family protein [Yoonia sp. MH D7]
MATATKGQMTGWKFLAIMVIGFGVIIAVNLTLAFKAVSTFPGLETRNSYVASQSFDVERTAQLALGWEAQAAVRAGQLRVSFRKDGVPVEPVIASAVLGRATHVASDQTPILVFDGADFVAPVDLDGGNWNLRLVAIAADGTEFRQRMIVDIE